jgi:hypothetical protein
MSWEEVDNSWKKGEVYWQRRQPGGECLCIEVWDTWEEYKKKLNEEIPLAGDPVWSKDDFPILRVLHPTEGLIVDPSYYYESIERAMARAAESECQK